MEKSHPSRDIQASLGTELSGMSIALCMTGSVAVVRAVDLAKRLMRHGAVVHPVLSEAASKLIGADLIEWATGSRVITSLSGAIEHV